MVDLYRDVGAFVGESLANRFLWPKLDNVQLYCDLAALPLVFALKGPPRLLMVAAGILIQVYRASFFSLSTTLDSTSRF
jgi:hypothetical protein